MQTFGVVEDVLVTDLSPQLIESLDSDARAELLRGAEEMLRGTVSLGIAADQRAASLTAGFTAAAVGAAAGGGALLSAGMNQALLVAFVVLSGTLALATMCAIAAARAIDFHIAGYEPRFRLKVGATAESLERDAIIDLQKRIKFNRDALEKGAVRINSAIYIACASVPLAIVAYIVTLG